MEPGWSRQPNSRNCFACGLLNETGLQLKFYESENGTVVAETSIPARFEGYPGLVHGGIQAAILDEVASRSAMTGRHHQFVVTAKLELWYRKPVPTETSLKFIGRLLRSRGRLHTAHAELRLPDGSIAAEAEAILADAVGTPSDPGTLRELGWKVYPDQERMSPDAAP